MKKALVVLTVVIGLTLVFGTVYAQMWDQQMKAEALAKAKSFKVEGVTVKSVDEVANTALVEKGGKTAFGRFDFAKAKGSEDYSGVKGLKVGDKLNVSGKIANGYNYVQSYEVVK
jgi:hypothetical protein